MLKTYFLFITVSIILLLAGIFLRKKRIGKIILLNTYGLFLLLSAEFTCLLALKIKTGFWLFNEKYNPNAILFEPHPYLISKPIPNAVLDIRGVHYAHNSEGWRGNEFRKDATKLRILAIGGSTTYGTGVSNHQTWPYYLDSLLSERAEVMNFGISGHSTVEHLILSLFIIPEYQPDIVVVLSGLNDLRSCYIKNTAPDYSYFHPYNLESVLGFDHINQLPRIAMLRVSIILLQKIGYYPLFHHQKIHIQKDHSPSNQAYMLNLYRKNLSQLGNILQNQGTKVIFIPQILNTSALKGNKLKWWVPFVNDNEFVPLIMKYNEIQHEVADSLHCGFINDVIQYQWQSSDFIDPSHFSPAANLHFANMIYQYLQINYFNKKQQ